MDKIKKIGIYDKHKKYKKELSTGYKYTNDGELKKDSKGKPLILSASEIKYKSGFVAGVEDMSYACTGYRDSTAFISYRCLVKSMYSSLVRERIRKGDTPQMARLYAQLVFSDDIKAISEGRFCDPVLTNVKY